MPARGPCARGAAQADRRQRRPRGWRRRREGARASRAPNGLNAATGEYEDLVKAGVIDAAKVTRSALQNAASIAALFLTTEAVIADKPEEKGAGGMPVAACPAWAAWATWTTSRSRPRRSRAAEAVETGRPPGRPVLRATDATRRYPRRHGRR